MCSLARCTLACLLLTACVVHQLHIMCIVQVFVLDTALAAHVLPRSRVVVGRKLGHGGNGVACEGTLDGAPVCLKTLHFLLPAIMAEYSFARGSSEHVAQVTSLQKEALNLVARPPHDNVVAFRGVVLDDDGFLQYVVLELLDGGSFDKYVTSYVASHGPADADTVLGWVVDTACGLAHMHHSLTSAVVHRDLKPENFLVRPCADGSVTVVVGDLGESKALDSGHPVAMSVVGNNLTKAPEVVAGKGFGPHSDVYSWAMCAYLLAVQALAVPAPPNGGSGGGAATSGALVADPIGVYCSNLTALCSEGSRRLRAYFGASVDDIIKDCVAVAHEKRPDMRAVLTVLLAAAQERLIGRDGTDPAAAAVAWMVRVDAS